MKPKTISFIIPIFNESEIINELIKRMYKTAELIGEKYDVEIILIDDGSSDDTWEKISKISAKDNRFKCVKLAGNVGQQAAIMCGYKFAKGDAVISIDADMQDPPEVSVKLIEKWEEGAEIVFAIRKTRIGEPKWRLALIKLYYYLRNKVIKTYVPGNSGDFRLVDRKVVNAINNFKEKHPYVRGIIGKIGFKRDVIYYDRDKRHAGKGKYPLTKLIKLGTDGIFSMSVAPLRLAYIFTIIFTIIYCIFFIFTFEWYKNNHGLNFMIIIALSLLFYLFAIMLFSFLGIVGEYIGRIYDETKNRPLYIIDKTLNIN